MAIYEYEHLEEACSLGKVFEHIQSISEDALQACPECGKPVRRLISMVSINTPKTNSELKQMGFSKLVRRDKGVYENVTAQDGEKRILTESDLSSVAKKKK